MAPIGLGLSASPAQAHNSSYCGHYRSGYLNITYYRDNNGTTENAINHQHYYFHDMDWGSDHYRWKNC
jgi:hypothetical protein